MDNYCTELFTIVEAVIALPIFIRPGYLVTRFCNLADFVPSKAAAAGVCDRSVGIVAARDPRLDETKLFLCGGSESAVPRRIKSIVDSGRTADASAITNLGVL